MIPPEFADLSKKANDLFQKKFPLGQVLFCHKSASPHNMSVEVKGDHDIRTQKLAANIQVTNTLTNYGLTFTQKVNSQSVFTSEVTVVNDAVKDLKGLVGVSYSAANGKPSGIAEASYKQKYVNAKLNVDFQALLPVLTPSLVLGCIETKGYLAGVLASFDLASKQLKKWQYALGMDLGKMVANISVFNHDEFTASLYQRVNDKLETAVMATCWRKCNPSPLIALVSSYQLDVNTWMKARINTDRLLAVAYGFTLFQGVNLAFSFEVDFKNSSGNHRVGFSMEYET